MDTSETYIKMCEKAEEIQNSITKPIGLIGYSQSSPDGCVRLGDCVFNGRIWLPRQDQLQAMAHSTREKHIPVSGNHGLIYAFADWVENESKLPCASMEQLWLAFVMKEKYGKTWNGSDWAI